MRAVERTPWATRRSSRHDEICLFVSENPALLFHYIGAEALKGKVTIEAPCGPGFCDVLIETSGRTEAWFIEVKTDAERASAGDVIRQLRWYASKRPGYDRKHLVCVPEWEPDKTFQSLMERANVHTVVYQAMLECMGGP